MGFVAEALTDWMPIVNAAIWKVMHALPNEYPKAISIRLANENRHPDDPCKADGKEVNNPRASRTILPLRHLSHPESYRPPTTSCLDLNLLH